MVISSLVFFFELTWVFEDNYPELVKKIMDGLQHLHELGVPLLLTTIKAQIVALIQTENPEIYEKVASDKSCFWVSDSWVRRFVNRN